MPNSHTLDQNLQRLITARTSIADAITAKGGTVSQGDGFEDFPSDIASITNTYTTSDEGKVVSNGTLVAQGSDTVTQNGTVDTTLISSLLVNVASGSSTPIAELTAKSSNVSNVNLYIMELPSRFWVFGIYTYASNTSYVREFSIPEEFDTSNIGNIVDGKSVDRMDTSRTTVNTTWAKADNYISGRTLHIKGSNTTSGTNDISLFLVFNKIS